MRDIPYKQLQSTPLRWPSVYDLKKVWNPPWFQGRNKRTKYFEGWYFKQVDASARQSLSVIPGISLNKGNPHAFIQLIAGHTGETHYFSYPLEAFSYASDRFAIRVGDSSFSDHHLSLNVKEDGQEITGQLNFSGQQRFPVSLRRPGIMGWYRYVPFMECYHGVVSMNHGITGSVSLNGQGMDFTGGKGYVEKDWGSSMPESWIWSQCNHFGKDDTSLMLSIARIPWIGKSFPGFLGFFLLEGKAYHFATYTGARIKHLSHEDGQVDICIEDKHHLWHILGEKQGDTAGKGALKAPNAGQMDRVIHESVNARLHVVLMDKKRRVLFRGSGQPAGLEMVGDTSLLQP